MIQKRILSMLVLLAAVVTGAYATEFTSLQVGDVLHVGDVINSTTEYKIGEGFLNPSRMPATLVKANIGTYEITESETGDYYVVKDKDGTFFGAIDGPDGYEGGYWPATATSDGISVTAVSGTTVTFAVHEAPPAIA